MSITRRLFLGRTASASAVALTVSAPVVAEAVAAPKLTDQEKVQFHIDALKELLTGLHPTADAPHGHYNTTERGSGCIVITAIVNYIPFDGPGLYEVEDGNRMPVYWVEGFYSTMDRTHGYRACHSWKGKRQGPWIYFGESDLRLCRKVAS